ncbi:hypothetical protein J8281_18155 [Aquimarina sp. U1-2]|uniref:hypothetical protein n=1 Tax=Aquimarina sp. U1-2 TaxID=2823141 RepID=UPI001AECC0FA|nr:hypothetical protein [Aquimarina sp. U1-2]MBP2834126.1 hypothetical protein [Aquimarina sp. U1-2]
MKNVILVLCIAFTISGCNSDDDTNTSICDQQTIVSAEQYENAPKDQLFINSVAIIGDCLSINFSSSGCDGNSWEVNLIDSEIVALSLPPQRNLRLSLKNDEACEAFITKERTFDIRNLRVSGDQVVLSVDDFEDLILYEY